ncbi:hypothetical protein CBS101457_002486 [Exobasidium rhododendri]|nr:hypothetical protein CBS101457_002486 [Exobasidium rhododendri]
MASLFPDRTHPDVLCLFDVDGTLSPARLAVDPSMSALLAELRKHCAIGFVGGSDLVKITGQLQLPGHPAVLDQFDYCFAENGLTAYRMGKELASQSFIGWIGEEQYKVMVKFILRYISELDLPIMRGTFVEFRNGMINVSPIGRNASTAERHEFEAYDKIHQIRAKFVEALKAKFSDSSLTFSIGGQISFDVFPTGWDKTFALNHVKDDGYKEIHFFGDKTFKGGNDYEIYSDPRTIGHSVTCPEDTMKELKTLFKLA